MVNASAKVSSMKTPRIFMSVAYQAESDWIIRSSLHGIVLERTVE